jgi:hypothetical protein
VIWKRGLIGSTVAVMALAAGSWTVGSSAALLSAEGLLTSTVAVVSEVPTGHGKITRREFQHELLIEAAAAGGRSVPRPGEKGYEKRKTDAVNFLLEGVWILGQAAEMHIRVTRHQISRELALIKRESFKSAAEFRRFLRESHYTYRDVRERVRVQLLSQRLQRRISRRIERESRNEFEEKKAFREFVAEFNERWRSRTVCAPEYATERCSNGPVPSGEHKRPAGKRRSAGAKPRLPAM